MTRTTRRGLASGALLLALAGSAAAEPVTVSAVSEPATASAVSEPATVSAERGRALFVGQEPLQATLRDHTIPLPAETAVCQQCHIGRVEGQGSSGAPLLTPAWLLEQRARRNGPPSAYSRDSFCRVLTKGIDPVWIMVSRAMPLFVVSDAQCASLWLYLSGDAGKS